MIKIDEFQREFFDILVETKGFFIEEIGDANASIWIATKTLDSGLTYSIIISDKNNKEKTLVNQAPHQVSSLIQNQS